MVMWGITRKEDRPTEGRGGLVIIAVVEICACLSIGIAVALGIAKWIGFL